MEERKRKDIVDNNDGRITITREQQQQQQKEEKREAMCEKNDPSPLQDPLNIYDFQDYFLFNLIALGLF